MSVEVDVEPLDCPRCRESNVPVMSMSCPHSYCLGCLQKLTASGGTRRREERERERRRCDGEREGDETVEDVRERQEQQQHDVAEQQHHKKRDDWLRCPVCDADGAFRVMNNDDSNNSSAAGAAAGGSGGGGGSGNHVNLKACELMGKAAALQMALFSERDRNQDVLRKCAAEYESVIVAMKSEALRNQKEILQLRESLDVKCRVIFHLQREVERLRADLWKAAAEAGEEDQQQQRQQQQQQQLSSAAAFQGKRKREDEELVRGDLGVVVGRQGYYDSTSLHSWEQHQQQQEKDDVLLPTDAVFRHKRQRENGSFSSSISGGSSFVKVPAMTAKTTMNLLNDEGATKDAAASYGRFVAKVNGLQRQQANIPSTTNSSAPVVDDDEDDDAASERKALSEHQQQLQQQQQRPGQPDISSFGKKKGSKLVPSGKQKGRKKLSKFIPSDPETRQKNDEEKVENHVSNAADREICSVILASMAEKKTTTTTSESDDEVIKRNQDGDGDGDDDGQQVDCCLDDDDAEDSEEERDPSSAREESVERKVTNDDGKRLDGVDAAAEKKKKATESEDPARTKTSNTGHRPTPPSTSTSSVISADSSINDSSAKGNNKMTKKDDDERDDNDAAAAEAEAAEASSSPSKAEDRGGGAAATATCRRGYIRVPGPHDVVLGRGGFANNHPGNVRFRQLVREHKRRYLSVTKGEKPNVSKRVVQIWRQQVPPGRFLARSDGDRNNKSIVGEWRDIGDAQARVKASQCLRERTEDAKMLLQQIEQERAAKRKLTSKRSGGICFATSATAPQAAAATAAAFPDMNLSDVTTHFNPMAVAQVAAAGNNNTGGGGGGGSSSGSDVGMALGGSPIAHLPQHSGGGGGGPLNGFPIRMPPAMFPSVIVEEQRQQQLGGGGGGSNDYFDADIKEAEYHRNMMLMHQERMQVQMQMRSMGDNLRVGLKQQHQQHQHQLQHPTSFHGLGGTATAGAFGSSTFELGGGGGVAAAAAAAGGPMSVTTTVKGYFGPQGINSSTQLRMGVSNAYHVPPPPVASSPSPYDDGSP